jgi:hydroxypyruvate reductase
MSESESLPVLQELRRAAREIFDEVLEAVDARRAMLDAVKFDGGSLRVCGTRFDPQVRSRKIFSVALGKAAAPMAAALDEQLDEALSAGVLSSPRSDFRLRERWRVFEGGHPLPNESSMRAARAAFDLLREADDASALVIFLVSGGGSAMLELPSDSRLTLEDLREANRVLISCGAQIDEVNAVRRALSAVKGGKLAACAPRATQVTLIVSDVGAGRAYDVASGPTLPAPADSFSVQEIIRRYGLKSTLPPSIIRALEESGTTHARGDEHEASREFHVLLDNARACEAAATAARARGFAVEIATDLVEQRVEEGATAMISRLAALYASASASGHVACLISGGEFSCPVRGGGMGGRNSETALRCAFEFEKVMRGLNAERLPAHAVALSAGTDGIDGNSPSAGACSDETTLARARALGLDASKFLEESDAYSLFDRLGDAVMTGATGTNVRDVRILLAG